MNEKSKLSTWGKGCFTSCAKQESANGSTCGCCCPMLGFSMLFISAVCIGIGILSILGANWETIPNIVKIIFYLALLSVNIYWLCKAASMNNIKLKEGLIIVLAIMLMAGIVLVSDVFCLSTQYYDNILIWCILSLPLLFITDKSLLGCFWIPLFLLSATTFLSRFETSALIIDTIHLQAPGVMMWLIAFALLMISVRKGENSSFGRAANFWFIGMIALTLLLNEIFQDVGFYSYGVFLRDLLFTPSEYCWIYWVACAIALSVFIYSDKNGKYNGSVIVLLIMILFNYIAAYTPLIFIPNFGLMAAVCTLAVMLTALVRTTEFGKNGLSKLLLGLICLRIILIYNQNFGSLALTGLGLICAGIVFVWIAKRINIQCHNTVVAETVAAEAVELKKEIKKPETTPSKSKTPIKKAPAPKKKVVKKENKTSKK